MVGKPSWPWKLPSAFLKNTAGLYLDTFTSYLFPLITLPYVVRVLGARGFGLVAFAQSFVGYLNVLVDFALAFSGTRAVAQCSPDRREISQVVANGLALRLGLATVFFPLVFFLCHSFAAFREAKTVVLILYLTSFATAISASWLFLAFEEMWVLARVNLLINLGVMAAIFTLVRSADDVVVYAAILAAGPLAGSVISLSLAFRRFPIAPILPRISGVLTMARTGFTLSLSQVLIALYTTGNSFILGTLASKETVGYFAAADKIVRAVLRLVAPLTTGIFPRMVHVAKRSVTELLSRTRLLLILYAVMGFGLTLLLWLSAPWVVPWFFGSSFSATVPVLRILSLIIFFNACTNVLGFHLLLPAGHDRAFTAITLIAGMVDVALAGLFVPNWQAVGMALAIVGTEAFVAAALAGAGWRLFRRESASTDEKD
ncbi:hypothetical protein EG19_05200 [Thermoanaerobaculum aquaticum]|uniref:Uncharacterized protein n=1 Tax=Thermoanaerobaculum aquaticum TaxID=1312852 RepID=A0A062XW22_9BACT|nr:hypothetical protein EG19_05200 [Thermoanaerobaculum aquaticum]